MIKKHSLIYTVGYIPVFLLFLLYSTLANANASSAGITPTRVVIADGERSSSFTLRNLSETEVSYRLNLIEMGLDQTGRFRTLSDNELHPDQKSLKKHVRFSPRQVRLKPGASQVVRVIARRNGMQAGEYRSHLLVQSLPVVNASNLQNNASDEQNLLQSQNGTNVGVTIPIIVRHKQTDAAAKLHGSSLAFNSSGNGGRINLQLGLQGNRSAFGDFKVLHVQGKKETVIGELKSFALFYPYPREDVAIRLNQSFKKSDFTKNSKIRVTFINRAADSAKDFWMDVTEKPRVL